MEHLITSPGKPGKCILTSALSITISCSLLFSSCATIFCGTRQSVKFTSIPDGATVQVNGIDRGKTPVAIKMKRRHSGQVVTVKAQGYESKTFTPETGFNPVTLVGLLFPPFIAFDLLDGAMWKYHPKHYNIELDKSK